MKPFESINQGFNSVFVPGELSLGVVVPIEHYAVGTAPDMTDHLERVKLVEDLGFKAVWTRDIPLNVPGFGDVGQTFDPFTYLGFLAGQTDKIALGVSSIALPLHHPVHVAKAASTVDRLSGGRLILGVASGDRPDEYPAMGINFENRGELFREAFAYVRAAQEEFPALETRNFGALNGRVDVLPKAAGHKLPMLITGHSRQNLAWNAENGDGWMYYLRDPAMQKNTITEWRDLVSRYATHDKPFMQAMYVILHPDPDFKPQPIQLGFRTGLHFLNEFLQLLKEAGVNHLAINLRFETNGIERTLTKLAEYVLPEFHLAR
ncbi:LLM class oxidoreductase [Neolewinella aurantiaca]|uniref:LLM class oxidoreductase n=1 Tax=Neolewinella aurantiaca TaxID=2602767 RepID=A0A5C7FH88_9BACT|nr:LLM class oxidoreductase [Neolewinella aurantiaca]TXF89045.1 LLM class oxidoreductase [Neolewinella aurantiaca]